MVTMTQAKFDEAITAAATAAATAAVAAMPKAKTFAKPDKGAVWYTKPTEKNPTPEYTLDGNVHPKCPHCDTVTLFKVFLYDAGGDGVNNKPVHRLSLLIPKDKES